MHKKLLSVALSATILSVTSIPVFAATTNKTSSNKETSITQTTNQDDPVLDEKLDSLFKQNNSDSITKTINSGRMSTNSVGLSSSHSSWKLQLYTDGTLKCSQGTKSYSCNINSSYVGDGYSNPKSKVVCLQALLRADGSSIDVDGQYGSETKNAIMQFQSYKNIGADGIAGPRTFKMLAFDAFSDSSGITTAIADK